MRDVPWGYHLEWCVDTDWKVGNDGKKCRMKGCKNPSVAALRRKHRCFYEGFRWWHYCGDHLYGREIRDGVVKFLRLVKNDLSPSLNPRGENS